MSIIRAELNDHRFGTFREMGACGSYGQRRLQRIKKEVGLSNIWRSLRFCRSAFERLNAGRVLAKKDLDGLAVTTTAPASVIMAKKRRRLALTGGCVALGVPLHKKF